MNTKRMFISFVAFALSATSIFGISETASAAGRKPSDVPDGEHAVVSKVIDGNTIQVNLNGQTATVHYIGLAAPVGNACYAAQATAANAALMNGQRVILETDTQATDAKGTLLRYVYLLDGRMANEELLANGSARTAVERPNTKRQDDLAALEQQAAAAKRGLWGQCRTAAPKPIFSATVCDTIKVEDLMVRTATFTDRSLLKNGDCVNIVKAENIAGPAWGGKYIFHPAGSTVTLTNAYLRWKDAFVPMTIDSSGNPFVFKSQYFGPKFGPPAKPGQRPSIIPAHTEAGMSQLERVPEDPSLLRLPGLTQLFRDQGNGKYTALVDVFTYKSGDLRNPVLSGDGLVI